MTKRFLLPIAILSLRASALGQGTIINNPASLPGATAITFDTGPSSTISNLPTLGLTVTSLDGSATPFISGTGGIGVGTLTSNALGNNRIGQLSYLTDAPTYDSGTIRSFQFALAVPATAFGFSLTGWGGAGANHTVQFFDTADTLISGYNFSQLGITANDDGGNGFFAFMSTNPVRNVQRVVFTPSSTNDFLAVDNVTFQSVPEPSSLMLAAFGTLGMCGLLRMRRSGAR